MEECEDCLKLRIIQQEELESMIDNLPRTVRLTDGLKPGFFLLRDALTEVGTEFYEAALHSLHTILDLIDEEGSFDFTEIVDALRPLVEVAFSDSDVENKRNASWVTALWARRGHPVGFVMSYFLKWINEGPYDLRVNAVWNLLEMSKMGENLSDATALLEDAMDAEDWLVRNYASEALSNEYARSGIESPLKVDNSVFEKEGLDSDWTVKVRHRRSYAGSTTPSRAPKYTAHFRLNRHCAVCGDPEAVCIWYMDDSGTGWRDRTHEYFCEKCGTFTVYRYFD